MRRTDRVVLHVAAHPDDELIGAPATLMALRDEGFRVVNLALGLGAPGDRTRRRAELGEATARAGFELVVADPPLDLSAAGSGPDTEAEARDWTERQLEELRPLVVVSPSSDDVHPSHELAGRAVREALDAHPAPPAWWAWGLWGPLREPTLYLPFDERRMSEIAEALAAHAGELARNDFRRLVESRAAANAILGPELVFGFGSPGRGASYAELLAERISRDGRWIPGARRELDPAQPLG